MPIMIDKNNYTDYHKYFSDKEREVFMGIAHLFADWGHAVGVTEGVDLWYQQWTVEKKNQGWCLTNGEDIYGNFFHEKKYFIDAMRSYIIQRWK